MSQTRDPAPIPFPWSSFPGGNTQESAGRLVNCYVEPLGEPQRPTGPAPQVWRRSPGLTRFTKTAQTNYRGGLLVAGLSYETFTSTAITVDSSGTVTVLGTFNGTKKVSIARNQKTPNPDVVAVDIDNGAFTLSTGGAPVVYNGGGALPQPTSVCFQDGYFFFLIGDCRCFASGINALTQNSQTFITANAKADVQGMRAVAYLGVLWIFTSGHCEVWQDTAAPTPAFPYTRQQIIEFGLLQTTAIAGMETGFSELLWVAHDFSVRWAHSVTADPPKVSPPDLDRLIEKANREGKALEASCYIIAGQKFWVLSCSDWTWEFNVTRSRWNERMSLAITGLYGRWRATCGHLAFNKWIVGDQQSGNLLFIDPTALDEVGAPLLFRIESGPVSDFPGQIRIARADFQFDMGVGISVGTFVMNVTGTAAGTNGVVRLTVDGTYRMREGDTLLVSGVAGTVEANGTFENCHKVDDTHVELPNTAFASGYLSGGTAADLTSPPNAVSPTVAISTSLDGGISWGNPLLRQLGMQMRSKRVRASVKNMGLSGPMGNKWRLDVTDPVYVGFIQGTQSSDPKDVGA